MFEGPKSFHAEARQHIFLSPHEWLINIEWILRNQGPSGFSPTFIVETFAGEMLKRNKSISARA